MKPSKKIAVTGGIGSGKSTVLKIISQFGYPVFSCDEISKELWKDAEYLNGLAALFPECAKSGAIDKTMLSRTVFENGKQLLRLNAYAHPKIMQALLGKMREHSLSFAEVPLLYEGGFEDMFDGVIAVIRNKEERIAAVRKRDGLSQEEIKRRISAQIDQSLLFRKRCVILENDGTAEELQTKTVQILKRFEE